MIHIHSFPAFSSHLSTERRLAHFDEAGGKGGADAAKAEAAKAKEAKEAAALPFRPHELNQFTYKKVQTELEETRKGLTAFHGEVQEKTQELAKSGLLKGAAEKKAAEAIQTKAKEQLRDVQSRELDVYLRSHTLHEDGSASSGLREDQVKGARAIFNIMPPEMRNGVLNLCKQLGPEGVQFWVNFFTPRRPGAAPTATADRPLTPEEIEKRQREATERTMKNARGSEQLLYPGWAWLSPRTYDRNAVEGAQKSIKSERESYEKELKGTPAPSAERVKVLNERVEQLQKYSKEVEVMAKSLRRTAEEMKKDAGSVKGEADSKGKIEVASKGGIDEATKKTIEGAVKAGPDEKAKKAAEAGVKGGPKGEFEAKAKGLGA